MSNVYAKEFGVPLPKCCSLGACCKGASPSTPYHQLLPRAVAGDDFARGFFSIMVPYASHAEAERVVPGVVERTLLAAEKQEAFTDPKDVVFYSCRYQTTDNRCGVWEDRPQFCRDYPDTPFVVMAPGCAFESWGQTCKQKFYALKDEVSRLKELKTELNALKAAQAMSDTGATGLPDLTDLSGLNALDGLIQSELPEGNLKVEQADAYSHPYTKIDALFRAVDNTENLSLVLSLTSLYVASPLQSAYFVRSWF